MKKSPLSTTGETLTSFDDITSYNNFYEYGPYKEDPKAQAWRLKPRPWTITVEGYAAEGQTLLRRAAGPRKDGKADLLRAHDLTAGPM